MADWNPKRAYGPAQPGIASTPLYTAPAGGAVIKEIKLVNTNAAAKYIKFGIGGVTDAQLTDWVTIDPLDTSKTREIILALATSMAGGDILYAIQETAAAITVTVTVEEYI